jgi:hypothetical protein
MAQLLHCCRAECSGKHAQGSFPANLYQQAAFLQEHTSAVLQRAVGSCHAACLLLACASAKWYTLSNVLN